MLAAGDFSFGTFDEEGAAETRGAKVRDTPTQRGAVDGGGVGVGGCLGQASGGYAAEGGGYRCQCTRSCYAPGYRHPQV